MKAKEFITESIEDKGIFKAMFFGGLPGGGKSTVLSKITDGTIAPRVVNTDKTYDFLLDKNQQEASNIAWALFGPLSKTMNKNMLFNYLNSMLPLFIDGTSANTGSLLRRDGILKSIGYDTSMIWVNIELDTAIERMYQRSRKVDTSFIKHVHKSSENNKKYYQSTFGANFIEVDNNDDNFSAMETKTFNIASQFFNSTVSNPIGNKTINDMKERKEKYLTPNMFKKDYIDRLISVWYQQ